MNLFLFMLVKLFVYMENQFDNESMEEIPDPDKEYYYHQSCFPTRGLTYLMKLVLLTKKYPQLVKKIELYRHQINQKNKRGFTALMIACINLNEYTVLETIDELIKNGANVNERNEIYRTALFEYYKYVSSEKDDDKIIEKFMIADYDFNIENIQRQTILMEICTGWLNDRYVNFAKK